MATPRQLAPQYPDLIAKERETGGRYEIQNGVLVAIAGGTLAHSKLTLRWRYHLQHQGFETGCEGTVHSPDGKLKVDHDPDGSHRYPDVGVVCGKELTHPENADAYTNPVILVEVTSSNTAIFDRNGKKDIYPGCKGLAACIVCSQDSRHVEVHRQVEARGRSLPISTKTSSNSVRATKCSPFPSTPSTAESFDALAPARSPRVTWLSFGLTAPTGPQPRSAPPNR